MSFHVYLREDSILVECIEMYRDAPFLYKFRFSLLKIRFKIIKNISRLEWASLVVASRIGRIPNTQQAEMSIEQNVKNKIFTKISLQSPIC